VRLADCGVGTAASCGQPPHPLRLVFIPRNKQRDGVSQKPGRLSHRIYHRSADRQDEVALVTSVLKRAADQSISAFVWIE
jgi:hypothetical protein